MSSEENKNREKASGFEIVGVYLLLARLEKSNSCKHRSSLCSCSGVDSSGSSIKGVSSACFYRVSSLWQGNGAGRKYFCDQSSAKLKKERFEAVKKEVSLPR
ncbi:Uncharacterized protein Rs2_21592 [Raphanus sativus]|nr:Uncharacterized protein Rs2_21592 [Raphanus sativus]